MPALKKPEHERFARLRVACIPARAAAKAIGYSARSGQSTKLDQRKDIQERIAELAADEIEVLRAKRHQVETATSNIAYGDGSDFPGRRWPLRWGDRLNALAQLRDLHGFKSAQRLEHTGKGGGPITSVDLSKATDEQLTALEAIFGPLAGASDDDAPAPGRATTTPA